MPLAPYAKLLMTVDGGAPVSGGQTVAGSNVIQLFGESTSQWTGQLWEIYQYPLGFACPAGWTNVNGVYRSTAVTPPSFTIDNNVNWGKYLFRLTVNDGFIGSVYHGPDDAQPLVDQSSGLSVASSIGTVDVGFLENFQFDAIRGYIGELQRIIRTLDAHSGGGGGGGTPGGSNGQFQYKNGALFAGSANWIYDTGTARPQALNGIAFKPAGNALTLVATPSATRTLTLPDATDTLVGKATVDVFTNKTFSVDATGNILTSVTPAAGDILVHNGTKYVPVAKGANGTFVGVSGGVVGYYTPPGGIAGAANVGTGVGVWKDLSGTVLRFLSVKAGAGINVALVGDDITVSATASGLVSIVAPDWYIDPVAGNDTNSGIAIGSPLKTWAGMLAKWQLAPTLLPTGGTLTTHLLGSLPSNDPAFMPRAGLIGHSVIWHIKGEATTSIRTSTFTGITNFVVNPYQPWEGTDATLTDWVALTGNRIKLTSGAGVGGYTWVKKDLGGGTHKSEFGYWATPPALGGIHITGVTPSPGDSYVVEQLTQLYVSEIGMSSDFSNDSFPIIAFSDIEFPDSGFGFLYIVPTSLVQFYGCRIHSQPQLTANAQVSFINCGFEDGLFAQDGSFAALHGGVGFPGVQPEINAFNAILQIDGYFVSQGCPIHTVNGTLQWGIAGVDDVPSGYPSENGGGITVGHSEGTGHLAAFTFGYGGCAIYGRGNATSGVDVGANGKVTIETGATLNVTGATSNFTFRGLNRGWAWNAKAHKYLPYTIATSWANLVAGLSSSGFGGAAHDPQIGAVITFASGLDVGVDPYHASAVDYTLGVAVEVVEFTVGGKTLTLPASPYAGQRVQLIGLDEGTGGGAPASPFVVAGNGKNINGSSPYTQAVKSEVADLYYNGTQWRLM